MNSIPAKYTPDATVKSKLDNIFTYHSPKLDQPERYVEIRTTAKSLASLIVHATPVSREQSLALTKLEECCFWANAAIARNE